MAANADGRTILFVTHDMSAIERFCDRAMLLERGEVASIDTPERVSQLYREINFGGEAAEPGARAGQEARIGRVWVEGASGDKLVTAAQGQSCRVSMEVEFLRAVEFPVFTVAFRNEIRHTIFTATSEVSTVHVVNTSLRVCSASASRNSLLSASPRAAS